MDYSGFDAVNEYKGRKTGITEIGLAIICGLLVTVMVMVESKVTVTRSR